MYLRIMTALSLFLLSSCNPLSGGSDGSVDTSFGEANEEVANEENDDTEESAGNEQEEVTPSVCEVDENLTRSPFANSNEGDAGTSSNPFVICTLTQLNRVRDYLDSHFDLMANIDASDTQTWGDYQDPDATPNSSDEYYEGFEPIGSCVSGSCDDASDQIFTGSFDGNNYKISNLYINRPDEDRVAMFHSTCRDTGSSCTESADFIKNLELEDVYVRGNDSVASLVSMAHSTNISNIIVSGETRGNKAGGVIFDVFGTVDNVHATMDVYSVDNPVGGISSLFRYGTLSNSSFTGDIEGEGDTAGLVGYVGSNVTPFFVNNCFFKGTINSSGTNAIGALIGGMSGSQIRTVVSNSYAEATITAVLDVVGGLVGSGYNLELVNVFFTGSVSGRNSVGGLIGNGNNSSSIKNSFSRGSVIASGAISWSNAGGLAAAGVTVLENSYSNSSLVQATRRTGGLLAEAYSGSITNSYSASYIDTNNSTVCSGGLVGCGNGVTIDTSFATGDIDVITGANNQHGPLIGVVSGTPATDYTDLFYSSAMTISNTAAGAVTDHSSFASAEALSYFQGPVNATNSNANEIYENWNFSTVWQISNGELPKLRCPQTDDSGTPNINEVWQFDCSVWENAQ